MALNVSRLLTHFFQGIHLTNIMTTFKNFFRTPCLIISVVISVLIWRLSIFAMAKIEKTITKRKIKLCLLCFAANMG